MIDDRNGHLTEFRILAVLILAALGGLWILASDDWRAALEYALGAGAILLAFAALAVGQVAVDRVGWGLFSLFWLVWLGSGVVLWSVGLPWQVAVPGGVLVGFGTAVGAAALVRDRRLRTLERLLTSRDGDLDRIATLVWRLEEGAFPLTAARLEAAPGVLRVAADPGEHRERLIRMLVRVRRPSPRLREIVRASRDGLPEWERTRVDRWLETTR